SWTAFYTADDCRAGLRFPRAAAEPPHRFRSCGVSPVPLFRRSLRLALQSAAKRNETDETMFTITKKTNH
ncbi:hypothetical protein P4699_23600, partial [Priestia aryabhattai]|uniref:hypothetical protein n=1 Tax=Priestia aryabhattai TaxID=412384 RepID=UPI002E1B48D9|nr:hypothetical protein [Priestia aryabhattai]